MVLEIKGSWGSPLFILDCHRDAENVYS